MELFFLLKFKSKIVFHLHIREWHTCEHSREVGKGVGELVTPPLPPHFFFNASQLHLAGWHELKVAKHSSTGYTSLVTLTHQRSLPPPLYSNSSTLPGSGGFFTSNTRLRLSGLPQVLQLDPLPFPQPSHPFCKSRFICLFYILSSMNTEGLINQLLYWEYCKQQFGNLHFRASNPGSLWPSLQRLRYTNPSV